MSLWARAYSNHHSVHMCTPVCTCDTRRECQVPLLSLFTTPLRRGLPLKYLVTHKQDFGGDFGFLGLQEFWDYKRMQPCLACFVIAILRAFRFNTAWLTILNSFSCKSSRTQDAICSGVSCTISLLSPRPTPQWFRQWHGMVGSECRQGIRVRGPLFWCEMGGSGHGDSVESCLDENCQCWDMNCVAKNGWCSQQSRPEGCIRPLHQ